MDYRELIDDAAASMCSCWLERDAGESGAEARRAAWRKMEEASCEFGVPMQKVKRDVSEAACAMYAEAV